MSLVRGAKILDVTLVTFCGLGRKIFAVDDWARVLKAFVVVDRTVGVFCCCVSAFCKSGENNPAVTDRGRPLTISQVFTLMVFMGLMVICSPMMLPISFLLLVASTTTTGFATLLLCPIVDFASTLFCFKSLIPRTMLSRLTTFGSVCSVALFAAPCSTTFDSSCCASSWAHDKISCSFSIPLQFHKAFSCYFPSEFSEQRFVIRKIRKKSFHSASLFSLSLVINQYDRNSLFSRIIFWLCVSLHCLELVRNVSIAACTVAP